MQAVYILVALMAVAASARPDAALPVRTIIPLISRAETREADGTFTLDYKTGDGINFNEKGLLKPTLDRKANVIVKEGAFSYTGPDGVLYEVTYVADENGFRAFGNHLPKSVVAPPPQF